VQTVKPAAIALVVSLMSADVPGAIRAAVMTTVSITARLINDSDRVF